MTAFSYYGSTTDISGVTSWLGLLLQSLGATGEELGLHLHHLGTDPAEGNLFQIAKACGVKVSGVTMPGTTRNGVIDILRYLNRTKPQVYVPQSLPAHHFAARIAESRGLPWIFTIHSDDPEYWALAESCAPIRSQGAIVAVSELIAEEVRHRFPTADVRVIPCGVAIPDVLAEWNDDVFRVIYSGRLVEEQKCVSKVLDVFIAACSHSPKIEAVFLGDGPERKTLEARVKHARLENRIRFTGRLTPDDVRTELLKAQAISLMSDYEGLPVSLLEAMACGLVPVCRNIRSGIPQIVHHTETGLLVENDVQAAAGSLVALAEDKTAWITMSANGRALVKANYSHEECMQKWLDLIREVGKKATVRYPLPVPWFPSLPPFDQRLRKSDRRSPLWMRRIKRKIMACGAGNDT